MMPAKPRLRSLRLSPPVRVGLAAAVAIAACAILVYMLRPDGAPRRAQPRSLHSEGLRGPGGEDWYVQNLSAWSALEFVPLADARAVRETAARAVATRYAGPELDEALFTRDLTTFLLAIGAPTPEQFVERLQPARRLRTPEELFNDKNVHAGYLGVTGRRLPADNRPEEVLALFWKGPTGNVGRPVAIATKLYVQASWTRPIPARVPPGSVLASLAAPDYSMYDEPTVQKWLGPFCLSFPRVTVPAITFDDAHKKHGRLMMCDVMMVLRTSDAEVFPVSAGFFFSPDGQCWQYVLAGAYYPYTLLWPL